MTLGGLPWRGRGMQCADGFHLRRRTADLSANRGTGRTACSNRAGSFTSAPTACSCAKKCAISWPQIVQRRIRRAERSPSCWQQIDHRERSGRRSAKARKIRPSRRFAPSKWMYWNVHLDGLECTHDLIVEREGVFKECIERSRWRRFSAIKSRPTRRFTKKPTWRKSSRCSIFSRDLGVDGHTISPGYEYDAAKKDMVKRLNLQPENFFLTRK